MPASRGFCSASDRADHQTAKAYCPLVNRAGCFLSAQKNRRRGFISRALALFDQEPADGPLKKAESAGRREARSRPFDSQEFQQRGEYKNGRIFQTKACNHAGIRQQASDQKSSRKTRACRRQYLRNCFDSSNLRVQRTSRSIDRINTRLSSILKYRKALILPRLSELGYDDKAKGT